MSDKLLKEYQEIKERAERLRREADRAEGQLDVKKAALKKEFGVSSLKEAKSKLEEFEKEEKEAEAAFKKALDEFDDEYGDFVMNG